MKLSFLLLTLAAAVARVVHGQGCTVIAIVMDESGSMAGEQEFLRNDAMPQVIQDLRLKLKGDIFVCSYGFPANSDTIPSGRYIGCSAGFDIADYDFVTSGGGIEDGWAAIKAADKHFSNVTEIDGIRLDACDTVRSTF